jgi:hypothetical protein
MSDTWLFRSQFDPYVCRDPATGHVRFANRMASGERFLERCVPVFSQPRPRSRSRRNTIRSLLDQKMNRAIVKSARLTEIRRLMPINPLDAYMMRVEAAFRRNCR